MTILERIFYIAGLIFLLFIPDQLRASRVAEPFVLVLDAGHGGHSTGAIGRKAKEKDINLAVTLLAGKYISEKYPDVKVLYTRKSDVAVDLKDRVDYANKSHANLFISIHSNAWKVSSVRGLEVYAFGVSRTTENLEIVKRENSVIYMEDNYEEKYQGFDPNSTESYIIFELMQNEFVKQSLDFATLVYNEMKSCAPWKDRGIKQEGKYLVLRGASMPRILIELDFISNPEAEKLLISAAGQKKYAQAICNAFGKYKASYDRENNINSPAQNVQPGKEPVRNAVSNTHTPTDNKVLTKPSSSTQRVYKVQLMSLPQPLPANSPHLKGYKASYYVENKQYKYTYGESTDWGEISRIRDSVSKDFKDAFIVAFENGVKVPVR